MTIPSSAPAARAAPLPGSQTALLELRGVSKTFRAGVDVVALHDVTLSIGRRELVAVTGPSGCGKTTLLSIMGTLERPTDGMVLLDGRNVAGMPDRDVSRLRARDIGFVFQTFNLLNYMTAAENVAEALVFCRTPARERTRRAVEALRGVGMGDRLEHYPPQLSGGERQRVAIARALVTDPKLMLADEPTGNLDAAAAQIVLDLLVGAVASGRTVVVASHDALVAGAMRRQIRISGGRLIADSSQPATAGA